MEKEKIVSIEDRIPKLKEARKKKANRRLLFYLSIFFILIAALVYLQSPLSHIKQIDISGNDFISDEDVIELSELEVDTNIWILSKKEIESKLQKHPMIQEVEINRKLPQTIKVKLQERHVVAYIREENNYLAILDDGNTIVTENDKNIGTRPLLHHFDDERFMKRMASELNETPHYIVDLISEISWEPTKKNKYKIVLFMNDGVIVHSTIRNFASKMKTYPSIISQLKPDEKGIVHMGVGIYVEKYKN